MGDDRCCCACGNPTLANGECCPNCEDPEPPDTMYPPRETWVGWIPWTGDPRP
jgi:hypothetical protein